MGHLRVSIRATEPTSLEGANRGRDSSSISISSEVETTAGVCMATRSRVFIAVLSSRRSSSSCDGRGRGTSAGGASSMGFVRSAVGAGMVTDMVSGLDGNISGVRFVAGDVVVEAGVEIFAWSFFVKGLRSLAWYVRKKKSINIFERKS